MFFFFLFFTFFFFFFFFLFFFFFFFFSSRRRHTRFDCDWSSDVCSSDLAEPRRVQVDPRGRQFDLLSAVGLLVGALAVDSLAAGRRRHLLRPPGELSRRRLDPLERSEERRVGKEGSYRWSSDHYRTKRMH